MKEFISEEHRKLAENYAREKDWLRWGPYLSERQWGTVREDYSPYGTAWDYFPHDHARSRTYRWGEDGIAGISDRYCNICFAIALWNGKDPILKERLFGLNGHEGNHGEDVKELYYYLENTPTHSYMKHLYKYPQQEFPYSKLIEENKKRGKADPEYELLDTGIFDNNEYFDVFTEYSKASPEDLLIRISVCNRSDKAAAIHLLPTLWLRNYWSFMEVPEKPLIKKRKRQEMTYVSVSYPGAGNYHLYFDPAEQLLFTENETNNSRLFDIPNEHPFKKDLFHSAVIENELSLATQKDEGTKFAPLYFLELEAGETKIVRLRLCNKEKTSAFGENFDTTLRKRQEESAVFFTSVTGTENLDICNIQKQAFAGLLWSKQYYNYEVENWLKGDPKQPPPPPERLTGRNAHWKTLRNHDVIAMPDKWEYPWYASWDLAFHCVTYAILDPQFAKEQLLLFTKEWYMAPNGQIPAYEWAFSDVNPPLQAWAALQIFKIEKKDRGSRDIRFLKRIFNKLALNFTWWVNRQDRTENNVFEGGFLGMDNIGVFDRSHGIPGNGHLEQVDGTSWMAFYCLNLLEMSLEIAMEDNSYEDMATKYFGHFVYIAEALNQRSKDYRGTWDEKDGFFYDTLILPDGKSVPIKVKSIVGLMSMIAILSVKKSTLKKLPKFAKSVKWFRDFRMNMLKYPVVQEFAEGSDLLLSLVPKDRMKILMRSFLDEEEFLAPHGIRSLSKTLENPYEITIEGKVYTINYEPAEATSGVFGGNSNWRGPIWMPINYLFIQSLREYYDYCGSKVKFEFPTGSGNKADLKEICRNLSRRLIGLFEKDFGDNRPVHALHAEKYRNRDFRDLILFYEYFHADNGRGVGASHQTGWTAVVANLIKEMRDY